MVSELSGEAENHEKDIKNNENKPKSPGASRACHQLEGSMKALHRGHIRALGR